MKKILYACCFLFSLSLTVSAQVQKSAGSFNLNGDLSFGEIGIHSLSGEYRHLLTDRLMLGIGAQGVLLTGLQLAPDERSKPNYSTLLSPSARYYLSPKNARMQWFMQGQIGLGNTRLSEYGSNGEELITNRFTSSLGVGAGTSWFLTPELALEAQLGFNARKVQGSNVQQSLLLDIGLRPFFTNGGLRGPLETNRHWLVNGHFQWLHSFEPGNSKGIDFELDALRFISPKFALGGRLAYNNFFGDRIEASLKGRYYLNPRQRLQVFFQLEVGVEMKTLQEASQHNPVSILNQTGKVGVGMNYFLTDRLSLELLVHPAWKGNAKFNVSAEIGLKYLLGK